MLRNKNESTTLSTAKAKAEYEQARDYTIKLLEAALRETKNQKWEGGMHWGHVGNMVRSQEQVSDLVDRLLQKGEYAPKNKA